MPAESFPSQVDSGPEARKQRQERRAESETKTLLDLVEKSKSPSKKASGTIVGIHPTPESKKIELEMSMRRPPVFTGEVPMVIGEMGYTGKALQAVYESLGVHRSSYGPEIPNPDDRIKFRKEKGEKAVVRVDTPTPSGLR